MRRQIITPGHLTRLPLVPVFYAPQGIRTFAVQVEPETIGAMSIEFGVEISVNHPNTRCLPCAFERFNGKDESRTIERTIFYGEWLVILHDEVLVFPPDTFLHTFSEDRQPEHENPGLSEGVLSVEDFRTGFITLAPGMTSPDDPNYQQQLPDIPV
jgi:hypothetical protein